MARNSHIRPDHVAGILNIIRAWDDEKLTWEAVCAASEPVLGYVPSRSGLSAHPSLLEAFQARKQGLKSSPPASRPMPSSLASAARQLASKNAEIAELRRTIGKLEETFERWQYNARLRRVTLEQLDEPLPHIDRAS